MSWCSNDRGGLSRAHRPLPWGAWKTLETNPIPHVQASAERAARDASAPESVSERAQLLFIGGEPRTARSNPSDGFRRARIQSCNKSSTLAIAHNRLLSTTLTVLESACSRALLVTQEVLTSEARARGSRSVGRPCLALDSRSESDLRAAREVCRAAARSAGVAIPDLEVADLTSREERREVEAGTESDCAARVGNAVGKSAQQAA